MIRTILAAPASDNQRKRDWRSFLFRSHSGCRKVKPSAFMLVDIRKDIWPITLCTQIPLLNIKEAMANPGLCGKMNIKMLHVHDQIDCVTVAHGWRDDVHTAWSLWLICCRQVHDKLKTSPFCHGLVHKLWFPYKLKRTLNSFQFFHSSRYVKWLQTCSLVFGESTASANRMSVICDITTLCFQWLF